MSKRSGKLLLSIRSQNKKESKHSLDFYHGQNSILVARVLVSKYPNLKKNPKLCPPVLVDDLWLNITSVNNAKPLYYYSQSEIPMR